MTPSAAPANAAEPGNRERRPPAIAATGICKSFATEVLRNVDLRIAPGTIHGLVGEKRRRQVHLGQDHGGSRTVGRRVPVARRCTLPASERSRVAQGRRCLVRAGTQPHRRSLHRRQPVASHLVRTSSHPPQGCGRTCLAVTGTRGSRTREPGHASRPAEPCREAACGARQSPRHGRRPARSGRTHLRPHRTAVAAAARSLARAGECRSGP